MTTVLLIALVTILSSFSFKLQTAAAKSGEKINIDKEVAAIQMKLCGKDIIYRISVHFSL